MAGYFDLVGDAVTTDKGLIGEYDASAGESFDAAFAGALDRNPLADTARSVRAYYERNAAFFGQQPDMVSPEVARAEVASRNLDLKIPDSGISRYELDMLQYLKQREIDQASVGERTRGLAGNAAYLTGALAGSLVDPINIGSAFIPVVGELRYAQWLANAGEGVLARGAVRASAGAIEGAAGAAILEPLAMGNANQWQRDYGLVDSFANVTLGGVLGGGLHVLGGAAHDLFVPKGDPKGASAVDAMEARLTRDDLIETPEHVQRDALHEAVRAHENEQPVAVDGVIEGGRRYGGRPEALAMPEGTLAREAQDLAAAGVYDTQRAMAREAFAKGGGTVGDFGPVLEGISDNWPEVVRRLSQLQDGEVLGALSHPEVGPIDVL